MKNHLKMCRVAISLVTVFRLVAFTASLWSGHNEARAAAKNVWIELPASSYTNSVNVTNCIGDTVYFEARNWWPEGASWSWSGATMTSPATQYISHAQKTYLTAGGPFSVTATYGGDTSYAVRVHVIKVASATASEGTPVDDGDGDPNTMTYVVCQGTGNVTVTATSYPSLTEEQLDNTCWCWGTTGGSGDDRLTRTVSKSECRSTTVTFSAGTSYKRVTVVVVCVGGLSLSEGNLIEGPSPPTYVTCVGTGDVSAYAFPDPWLEEAQLPGCWTFTGGTAVGLGKFERNVSKSAPGSTTFTATAGTSSATKILKVVEVASATASGATLVDDGDDDTNTMTYVVCQGTGNVTVTATPNPGLTELQLTNTCWQTIGGSGDNLLTRTVSKDVEGSWPVTFTAGSSSKRVTVVVLKTELKSIEFTSDHGLLNDNNSDWTDGGTTYATPEWVLSPARNNPISHTMNSSITLTVTVRVRPAGVPFDLLGDGPENYVDFTSTNNTSTGADQAISITANAALPNQVATLSKSIGWSIRAYGTNAVTCNNWSSGEHKIYVTYGTPAGSVVTEKRVSDVCLAASGQWTPSGCADAISTHLSGFRYDLNGLNFGPSPIWLLHAGPPYSSQCPGLADFINKHFQMLGLGAGVIKYCRALPDGTYAAQDSGLGYSRPCTPGNSGHTDPTTHDDLNNSEWLYQLDGSGAPNNYEATCLFNNKHYAVGVGVFDTPKEVVTTSFGTINWFYSVSNPPWNIAGCTISPWVEAP